VFVAATDAGSARLYYVALGDSLAVGVQPDRDGRNRSTSQGYVDAVARSLRRTHAGLRTVKLGCSGETARSMLAGDHCRYPAGSQLAQAESFLRSHPGRVVAVTVNIGDNDVEGCLAGERIDAACLRRQMAKLRKRLPRIARRLRSAGGAGARIVGLADYDQFLAAWLDGRRGRRFARRSVAAIGELNRTVGAVYRHAGLRAADAGSAFGTFDLTHYAQLRGHGRVPRAVQRICSWTWACSDAPVGFNDHANATGYRVLGRVVLRAVRGR
jgi:lysophospholipase L1-like esterase